MEAEIWIFVWAWIGIVALTGARLLRRWLRLRAAAPGRIRAAASMSDGQLKELSDTQFRLYKEAVDYGLRYKSGALSNDPEMKELGRRFTAENRRRVDLWIAADDEKSRLEKEAAAARARRDLGL